MKIFQTSTSLYRKNFKTKATNLSEKNQLISGLVQGVKEHIIDNKIIGNRYGNYLVKQ